MRLQVYEPLENERLRRLTRSAVTLQSCWRRYRQRKAYLRKRQAAVALQHAFRGWRMRLRFIRMRRAAVVIQCHLRGMFAREVAAALREMRRVEEAEARQREKDRLAAAAAAAAEAEAAAAAAAEAAADAAETLEEVSSISDQVFYYICRLFCSKMSMN